MFYVTEANLFLSKLEAKMWLTSVKDETVISHFCDAKHLCQEAHCQHLHTPRRRGAAERVNYLSSGNCSKRRNKLALEEKSRWNCIKSALRVTIRRTIIHLFFLKITVINLRQSGDLRLGWRQGHLAVSDEH